MDAMHGWKLLLTALGTGALLGTIGGTAFTPTLKSPPEQPWRQGLGPQETPTATYDIVEASPRDLSPRGWTYGASRAFPDEELYGARRSIGYHFDDETLPADEPWSYAPDFEDEPVRPAEAVPIALEIPAVEAAEAARDAARDAVEQGFQPASQEQPAI